MKHTIKHTINDRRVSEKEWYFSKENGVHRRYYSNGQIEWEQIWKDNHECKMERWYYENGQLNFERPSRKLNGYLYIHGIERLYHPQNGKLQHEVSYQDGLRHGMAKRYNEEGDLIEITAWVHGVERPELLEEEHRLERIVLLGIDEKILVVD
jgi:antitoxin component YwqK of YwqJK toxin-antitoxin module